MLAASTLTAYGADEIAVGAKNSAYYYDQQKMNIDQQGRLIEKFSESIVLANNYTSKFSPSTQDFDYNVGTIISNPGEITMYVSRAAARDNNVMIAISGHGIISPNVDNKQAEYEQFQALAKAGESRQLPYHIWNLGKLTDNDSGWKLSFNNEKGEYYEKTIRVDNLTQDCQLWGFIDYDYDYYYSNNDIASSDVNSTLYLIRPIKLMKDYDGPYELHELPITTASFPPYLTINGDTLTPIADDTTDVLIDLYSSTTQTWYLLGEYAGFKDRNRLGYYTDIDTGRNINLVFSGPRQAPYVATTSITRPIIGLWFHNDVNANLIFDGEDSWLLSQRYLTSGSAANEHQWFKVYDVRAYKGLGVSYVFHTATEGNWTGTGNYDYLVFCDDDHTASDWDHNDMIFGLLCNRPPVAVCHSDTTITQCSFSQIAIHGFSASDPDYNLSTVYAVGGTFAGDSIRFNPTAAGTYSLKLIATDTYGLADTCETKVRVVLNSAPDAQSPSNQTIFQCALTQIKLPGFTATDINNNLTSVTVNTGTLHGDTLWFTPVSGTNTLKIIATDACGLKDSSITTVTVNVNQPPVAISPGDTSMFRCDTTEICIPGFIASDPDGNLASLEIYGCYLRGDSVCMPATSGTHTLMLVATDSCGAADTSITNVTITLNQDPMVNTPADTTIFQCNLTQIKLPGFWIMDPDNNITTVNVSTGTLHGDTLWFMPIAGLNTIKVVATDSCGLKDSSITRVTVNLNTAPDAQSPADTTIFQCSLTQIKLPGFRALDAENNITSVVVTPGTLHGDTLWFTPVAGLNTCKIVVTDACGLKDSSITRVTVNLNTAPDAQSPADTSIFQCSLTQIQLPGFRALDAENNITSVVVTPGTLHGDTLWFTPVAGLNTCKIVVTDACGLKDSSITRVTVNLNTAPDAQSPADTTIFQCSLTQIQLPGFRALDAENNITSVVVTPGTLHGDTLWFTPVAGLNTLKIVVTDACGLKDSSITNVTVTVNSAPDAQAHGDTTIFQCSITEIRLPGFRAIDVNNNIVSVTVNTGTLHGDTLWFTPVAGLNTLKIIATDACGAIDSAICRVTVNINAAPDAQSPADTSFFQCNLTQIKLPGFRALDADNNITSVVVTPGTLHGDTLWFTPVAGLNTLKIVVTDACGLKDSSITRVTVNLNTAPVANCPNDTTVTYTCVPSQVCIGPYSAIDSDGNLDTAFVLPNSYGGTFNGTTYCFTPSGVGTYTIRYVARDECGAADTCATVVTVQMINRPPVANCHGDTTMTVCSLTQICLGGFTANDPDNNLSNITVTGGTLQSGGIVCFTPIVGVNTITLYAADSCGAMDTCQTRVTVILNSAPNVICAHDTVIIVDTLTQICVPGFMASDVDGNLISAGVVGAVMHGDTACFVPVLGINTLTFIARDACGLADTCITRINVALSHVGACPIITHPFDDTLSICAYGEYCDTIDVIDVDGDDITVTTTIGTLTQIIDVPGHWRGLLCFEAPDSACGFNYSYDGILRATDDSCGGCDSIIITYTVLGKITVSMPDSVGLWPGVADSFPVYIDAPGECFCLGGFVLTVTYDNSIFDILGVTRAPLISSAEYFFVNYNPSNPDCPENGSRAGAFKVVMINDLNNQIPAPTICDIPPHTPLFWVHVMARADYTYPTNFCVPICFQLCEPLNYQWNSISDISGNYVWKTEGCLDGLDNTWYLEMICGNLKILSNSNVIRGDVNLNSQPFEIGDAVTLANYLIDPTTYPMSIRQLVASDVNGDSIRGSIADLIYMINVINGTIRPKQAPSVNTMADFLIRQDSNGRSILSINASIPIGGFVFELPTNDAIVGNIEINSESGMDIRVTKHPNYLRVCAYSLEGRFIPEGSTELLSFDSDKEIQPASAISVSDNAGNLINGSMKIQLPLPTDLNISATYPNPFNSTIMIECALPADDNISLKIYDIAGRLVSNYDLGYQTAGYHKIAWNGVNSSGNQVSTGIYFAKLESNITHISGETKRLTLIK
jgi:hypothetical protein